MPKLTDLPEPQIIPVENTPKKDDFVSTGVKMGLFLGVLKPTPRPKTLN